MKYLVSIFIPVFAVYTLTYAQSQSARIDNIRTHMTDKALVVSYDLLAPESLRSIRVDFRVVDNRGQAIQPDSVSGDIGEGVTSGKDREIVWEIYKEYDVVYGSFKPVLVADHSRKHLRGPEFAALSLLLPGLGDYFVADPRQMKIKPYYKTAFTAGVLGISWLAKKKRMEIPAVWSPPGWYASGQGSPIEEGIYYENGIMIEPARTEYWLFPYDSEIILGIGIASWVFDALWVARRGVVNNRIFNTIPGHAALLPAEGGIMLSWRMQF